MPSLPTKSMWLAYDAAADYTGLSRRTLERAVRNNSIPYHRDPVTGRVRFHVDELDGWMRGDAKRGRRRRS